MAEPVDLLARSAVLGVLSPEQRAQLVEQAEEVTAVTGSILFAAGDPCDRISVLLSGRAHLSRTTESGHTLVLRECGPGEVFGQMAALDGAPHSVSATVDDDARLLAIDASRFRELLASEPDVALRLAQTLAGRVRSLSDELEAMKFESIQERVLRWLREHGARLRELRVTHQEIADQVGSTRENVSRVLGLLRDRGVLALGRGRIEILDHERLGS